MTPGQAQGEPADCLGGVRHKGGVTLVQALGRNVGTCRPDVNEKHILLKVVRQFLPVPHPE